MDSSTSFFLAYFLIVLLISAASCFFLQSVGKYSLPQSFARAAIPASLLFLLGAFALYDSKVMRADLTEFLRKTKTCTVQIRPHSSDGESSGSFFCEVELPPAAVAALARTLDQTGAVALTHSSATEGIRFEFFNEEGVRCVSFLSYRRRVDRTEPDAVPVEHVSIGPVSGTSGRSHDPAKIGGLLNQILKNSNCSVIP